LYLKSHQLFGCETIKNNAIIIFVINSEMWYITVQ
jgi:hypothetical protein